MRDSKAYNLTELVLAAAEIDIELVYVPEEDAFQKSKHGIHLLNPSYSELADAIATAEKDGFSAIYIHQQF